MRRHGPPRRPDGPIARGELSTARLHLGRLSAQEGALYSVPARETLALARALGLNPEAAAQLEHLLAGEA